MDTEKTKVCKKCGKELAATNEFFSKNASINDGLDRWCKKCKAKAQKDQRDKKLETPKRIRRFTKTVSATPSQEPLTTASPEAILAALRKGMAREIIQLIEERFQ
jgi:hypothetical protein